MKINFCLVYPSLSISLSFALFFSLFLSLSLSLSISLSLSLFVYFCLFLSISLYFCLFAYIYILSLCLFSFFPFFAHSLTALRGPRNGPSRKMCNVLAELMEKPMAQGAL